MSLTELQKHLEEHFGLLSTTRASREGGKPVFALEHDLNRDEIGSLSTQLRDYFKLHGLSPLHRLVWVVYASELGYTYEGDEYWQTFERETPPWRGNANRGFIRTCFRYFQTTYGGAEPKGSWAEQFSIICWPISNAILPRDLQRQLARVLYEARHEFDAEILKSPSLLGELIAAHSTYATKRFRYFVSDSLLIGLVAKALLLPDNPTGAGIITVPTLRRISSDLELIRNAGAWIRDARVHASRTIVSGVGKSGPRSATSLMRDRESATEQVARLNLAPELHLRPNVTSGWDVRIRIPSFEGLVRSFPSFRDLLGNSRCLVKCSSDRPLARGRLLGAGTELRLRSWPLADEALLWFENMPPELEFLLRTDCLLTPGPVWLYRILTDGSAAEVRSLVVRPGQHYILTTRGSLTSSSAVLSPEVLNCEGAHAYRLCVPEVLSDESVEFISGLGLTVAKNIRIRPACLPAKTWDNEGQVEWLSSDRPVLAVQTDHPLHELSVIVDDDAAPSIRMNAVPAGPLTYLALEGAEPGPHRLRFVASEKPEDEADELGTLNVMISHPSRWVPGISEQGALIVTVDPPNPSMEDLWEGRTSIEVHGPATHPLSVAVTLFKGHPREPLPYEKRIGPFPLPLDANAWQKLLMTQIRLDERLDYDMADCCTIGFSNNELGSHAICCERDFTPLRWLVREKRGQHRVQLIDDSGREEHPSTSFYEFLIPDRAVERSYDDLTSGGNVPLGGGMFAASYADVATAIVVAPGFRTLPELSAWYNARPVPYANSRDERNIAELVTVTGLWAGSRLSGRLAGFVLPMRRRIIEGLASRLFALICGPNWAQLEGRLLSQGLSDDLLEQMQIAVHHKLPGQQVARTLRSALARLAKLPCVERAAYLGSILHEPAGDEFPQGTAEFVLLLASSPAALASPRAGLSITEGLQVLLERPWVARAGRFLVLALSRAMGEGELEDNVLYRGWSW
jgi:hypothetical protein